MARYICQGIYKDGNGVVVSGGTITVYLSGSSTLATIYAAKVGGSAISNSVATSGSDGHFVFYVDDGDYSYTQQFKIVFSADGFTPKTYDEIIILPLSDTAISLGSTISGAASKTTPVDADNAAITDSAASHVLKKLTWANLKATLKTYFDTLYYINTAYTALASDISTTSTSYTTTGVSISLTVGASTIAMIDVYTMIDTDTNRQRIRVNRDSGTAYYYCGEGFASANPTSIANSFRVSGLSAGVHTFLIEWLTDAGTIYCRASTNPQQEIMSIRGFSW